MNFLTKISLKNSVAVILLTILVVVSGIISANSIKVETFPDVTFPALSVQAIYPSASSEEVEEEVTNHIEKSVQGVKGYDDLISTSTENMSMVTVTYPFGEDMDEKKSEVESALNKLKLPEDVETEVISFSAGSTPIYQVAVSSDNAEELQEIVVENLIPDIENVEGVGSVEVTGLIESTLELNVDEEKAEEYGLTLKDIQDAISSSEYAIPMGTLEQDEQSVPLKIQGELADVEDIEEIEISLAGGAGQQPTTQVPQTAQGSPQQAGGQSSQPAAQPSNSPTKVTLSEIAEVSEETTEKEISRFNGEDSLIIAITKNQDANTAEVVNNIKTVVNEYKENHNFNLYTVLDQGKEVEKSVSSLIKEGLFGALFTVVVILLFLRNIRATVIAIISLPVSIFGTIALLNQFGYTLNIMTLGGLAVAVGRIVDDSIVVIENIYRWKQEKGKEFTSHKELIYHATKEVMGAISSSTIATLVVFLPLAFVGGILGEFFRPFSLAVVFSILISLLVAIILIPVLGSAFFKKVKHDEKESKLTNFYEKLLKSSLRKKWIVFTLSLLLLVGSFGLIPLLGVSFLPSGESNSFEIEMTLPSETKLADTNELANEIEEYFAKQDEIEYSQVSIGFQRQERPGAGGGSQENRATFFIELGEGEEVSSAMKSLEKGVQEIADGSMGDVSLNTTEVQQEGPPSGNSIDISLYGNDLDEISEASTQIEDLLNENDQLNNITNNLNEKQPKWQFELNDTGKDLNVSPFQIVQLISERVQGVDGGTYTIGKEELDLSLQYEENPATKENLEEIKLMTAEGEKTIGNVVTITEEEAPLKIFHNDGKTYASVSATIQNDDTAKITNEVLSDIDALSLPDSVEVEVGGGLEMITEGFADLGLAMVAAIGLVFLILSLTFGGIITPIVILSSLIFVPIGALTGLLVTGQTLSMTALIGMLMLIGIVVTNAVVLLDRVEKNRKQGVELTTAIVEASKTRLRPILMTAFATIFALVPLALSSSSSGLISKGLAVTVIGGLTTSTLLTLIFVPVLYHVLGKYRKINKDL